MTKDASVLSFGVIVVVITIAGMVAAA